VATEILTALPASHFAGDTLQFRISDSNYPAADGYQCHYVLLKEGTQVKLESSADGDDHLFAVSSTITASYPAGEYEWRSYFTNGTERYPYESGSITIKPNYTTQTEGLDTRSANKRLLDAVTATFEGSATKKSIGIQG
jgi:hypothetical protein